MHRQDDLYYSAIQLKKGTSSKDSSPKKLKYDKSPKTEDYSLKDRCEYLTKQLEIKEALITELREYSAQKQYSRSPYNKDDSYYREEVQVLQQKVKAKDKLLKKSMLDNSQLYDENLKLKQKILDLEKKQFKQSQVNKFACSVSKLVQQCNPNYYQTQPSLKQCWDWLKLILEDYIKIKKYR